MVLELKNSFISFHRSVKVLIKNLTVKNTLETWEYMSMLLKKLTKSSVESVMIKTDTCFVSFDSYLGMVH